MCGVDLPSWENVIQNYKNVKVLTGMHLQRGLFREFGCWQRKCSDKTAQYLLGNNLYLPWDLLVQHRLESTLFTTTVFFRFTLGKLLNCDEKSMMVTVNYRRQATSFFLRTSRGSLGCTQPPIQLLPWRKTDHSPPSSVKAKNEWSCASTPPYAFIVWIGATSLCFLYKTQSHKYEAIIPTMQPWSVVNGHVISVINFIISVQLISLKGYGFVIWFRGFCCSRSYYKRQKHLESTLEFIHLR
jgi:hypothetical protein